MCQLLLTVALAVMVADGVLSQPDLCRNPRIDSITYIPDQQLYFFTSGGYYWLIKTSEFPPPMSKAQPLPHGFSVGEAAVYLNTLNECEKNGEKEIVVTELKADSQKLMVFDIRDSKWRDPVNYNTDKRIQGIQIDWTKPVNAMFTLSGTQVYAVQNNRYAMVDIKGACDGATQFGKAYAGREVSDFQVDTKQTIDGMTLGHYGKILIFTGEQFYEFTVKQNFNNGTLVGTKERWQSTKSQFFQYDKDCKEVNGMPVAGRTTIASDSANADAGDVVTDPQEASDESDEEEKSGSLIWIIIGVILLLVVIAVIAILLFMFVFRKKKSDTEGGAEGSQGVGSTMSGRNLSGRSASKTGASRTGSTASGVSASPSALSRRGASPSKMSMRSTMTTAPSASKTSGISSKSSKSSPSVSGKSKSSPSVSGKSKSSPSVSGSSKSIK